MMMSLEAGHAFSLAFTVSWKELTPFTRLLDLSNGDGTGDLLRVSSGASPDELELFVKSSTGGADVVFDIKKAFALDAVGTQRFLCTVTPDGKMEVFRNGMIIGRLKADGTYADGSPGGQPMPAVPTGQLHLARPTSHQQAIGSTTFKGWLGDVCTWKKLAVWNEAANCLEAAGSAGGAQPGF